MKALLLALLVATGSYAAPREIGHPVPISDLDRLSLPELQAERMRLRNEVHTLAKYIVDYDSPPEETAAQRKDKVIEEILRLHVDKWTIDRGRHRRLHEAIGAPSGIFDDSISLDTRRLLFEQSKTNLVVALPVKTWSQAKCRIETSCSLLRSYCVLFFQVVYADPPAGVPDDNTVRWNLPAIDRTRCTFLVRRFPDAIESNQGNEKKQ